KIGGCCISIHHGLSVLVNDSSVICYGSPTESPGHSTPLSRFPGQCDSPCYLFYQKFPICIHLSNATGGQFVQKRWLVALIFYNRRGVRMGRIQYNFPAIKTWKQIHYFFANPLPDLCGDIYQVTRYK